MTGMLSRMATNLLGKTGQQGEVVELTQQLECIELCLGVDEEESRAYG